jgi:hypothetical protein
MRRVRSATQHGRSESLLLIFGTATGAQVIVGEVVIGRMAVNLPSPSMLLSDLSSRSNNQRACQANIATHCHYH